MTVSSTLNDVVIGLLVQIYSYLPLQCVSLYLTVDIPYKLLTLVLASWGLLFYIQFTSQQAKSNLFSFLNCAFCFIFT